MILDTYFWIILRTLLFQWIVCLNFWWRWSNVTNQIIDGFLRTVITKFVICTVILALNIIWIVRVCVVFTVIRRIHLISFFVFDDISFWYVFCCFIRYFIFIKSIVCFILYFLCFFMENTLLKLAALLVLLQRCRIWKRRRISSMHFQNTIRSQLFHVLSFVDNL